ncbi:hypothetical protein RHODGE_RHODGE_00094 [Rhodoplanes serenus]|uniref:Copper chaperone PCu(A)C n=1 Tax=Rhodoplanes serenus TaxID=200615 RepID=A0A447CPD9_9BRAD|nr:copper chaperone PCu(A)C [Rhodoplanes serenus]VCU07004.1 hypothetical protein RHODGE_RHODGE_00094 [Rhodoplanes serenus]
MRSFAVVLWVCVGVVATAAAETYRVGPIEVAETWARATPSGASVTAGYMRITNHGPAPDRLLAIRMDAALAVDLLELSLADNVMRLRSLGRGVEIAAGRTVEFRPGAPWQAVVSGLSAPLRPGDRLPATLVFEQAGDVTVDLVVQPIGTGLRWSSGG